MIDNELVSKALYRKLADLVLQADRRKFRRPFALLVSDASGRTILEAILNWRRARNFGYNGRPSAHLPLALLLRSVDGEELRDGVTRSEVVTERPAGKPSIVAKEKAPADAADEWASEEKGVGEPSQRDDYGTLVEKEIQKAHRGLFNFLVNQIALATTFTKMTHGSYDEEQTRRNGDKAYAAYRSALDLQGRLNFSDEERAELKPRLESLKLKLAELGKIDETWPSKTAVAG